MLLRCCRVLTGFCVEMQLRGFGRAAAVTLKTQPNWPCSTTSSRPCRGREAGCLSSQPLSHWNARR